MFRAIANEEGIKNEDAIDVSSYAPDPYNLFSPFTYSQTICIPVPGQKYIAAHSVESIWQGLKIIDEHTDFSLFVKKPKKRQGFVQGHLYGDETLGIFEARERIYRPSYFYYIENYISETFKDTLLKRALENGVSFYDTEDNININSDEPLAHSVFLKDFFEGYYAHRKSVMQNNLDLEYFSSDLEFETLADPVSRAVELYERSSSLDKRLLIDFLTQDPKSNDYFHKRYYQRVLETLTNRE